MKITRTLLPNSSPEILLPMEGKGGIFQVVWIDNCDTHALLFIVDEMPQLLATHHNGYSCHALAKRICTESLERATQQLEFIRACGGTAIQSLNQFSPK